MQKRIAASFLALFLVLGPDVSQASVPPAPLIPDTAAGHVLSAWLKAFDSGDRSQMRQFIKTYAPSKIRQLDDQMSFRQTTGGFDLRKIVASSASSLTAYVQEHDSDAFARLTLDLEQKPPYRIASLAIVPAQRPPEFALPHLTQADLIAAIAQRAQQEAAADRFAGAVLVAKDGSPVFERAYGLADRARNVPIAIDTRMRIGSMSKMFTATAIMQLVQAGKIDLDKPFGTYITDYPNKTVARAVTIRQLLTHTGGTGDIFTPEYFKNSSKIRTLHDYITLFGERGLAFKPGSRWEYSNYGFILLGNVIERVSGQDYYRYVHDRIFVPAGMTSTGSEPEDVNVRNRSTGYMKNSKGDWVPNTDTLPYRGSSAGGGYSTVGDLLRFANALQAHTLLNARYTNMMTAAQVPAPFGSYGFDFGQETINGTECFGHNGGAPGMSGDLEICPAAGYVVAVLSNLDPPAAGRISDFITNRLPGPIVP